MKQASKSPRASLPSRPLLTTPTLRAITIVVQQSFRCRSSLPSNMSLVRFWNVFSKTSFFGSIFARKIVGWHTTLELELKYPKPNIFSKMMTFYKFWKLLLVAATSNNMEKKECINHAVCLLVMSMYPVLFILVHFADQSTVHAIFYT